VCQFGRIAGTLHLLGTQPPRLLGLDMQFFIDLQARIDGQRSQLCQQQVGDRRIQARPKHLLTELVSSLLDLLSLTQIFRIQACSVLALIVAQRHPIPTPPTDDQSLKQGRTFPRRTVSAIFSVGGTILLQLMQIRFVLLPSEIPHVSTSQPTNCATRCNQ